MKRTVGRMFLAVVTIVLIAGCATMQSRWGAAESADTIAAYEDFLKEYPEGDLAARASARRKELYEQRDWKDAEAKNTISAYEDFIRNYPEGRHKNDAYARLETLSPPKGKDSPFVTTEAFLKRYRQGVFMDEALSTLEKLYFEQAIQGNTISAYEDFLRRYPSGRFADDARRRMEKLSFEEARSKDTISAYEGYLNRYPQGAYADESRSRREELSAATPPAWGAIMYPKPKTNIRAKRSADSKLKGQLKEGQPVKVDFLQDGWYAVFPVTEKRRTEKKALGYVHAPLLIAKGGSDSYGSIAYGEKSAKDIPSKNSEAESPSVDIKNIAFRITEDGKELLFIEFNRFYSPAISGIEGEEPRIMLEIKNASPLRKDWAVIDTGGKFIRRIRSRMESKTHAALIVLDMEPSKRYFVNPKFYEKDNIYSLEISEEKQIPLP
jgi:outer membrane protein assembly factor BamD (BamD/ComL family)